MKLDADTLVLSATDLANHLACRHLTGLDLGAAEGRVKPPDWFRPDAAVLAERGLEHERAYLAHLERQGLKITRIAEGDEQTRLTETTAAMFHGAEVIAQATLAGGRWVGRADVLRRVAKASGLGDWSYEAVDTKLARDTKGGAVLQLCLYSELLHGVQGVRPEYMHVVPRRPDFPLDTYRVDDYLAYYRLVRRRLVEAVDGERSPAYPEPVAHCEICRWFPRCDKQRRADDHLSLVAGVSKLQTRELQSRDIPTLARLAAEPLPIGWKPSRGAKEGYGRVREQARVQLRGRNEKRHLHELLPPAPGHGLARLPEPSPGDVFLDLEADPYVDEGGLEYLFGWVAADEAGDPVYRGVWALDRVAERRGFEEMIDAVLERWAADPGMHVYHYGGYEAGAIKRLMGRHATRETDVDSLLRAGRFVDLHAIVKQSLRASVEEYSIKRLEPFYGFEREQPLDEAGVALRVIQRDLELGVAVSRDDEHAKIVEAYNREDCVSALALRDWLERLRAEAVAAGAEIARPPAETGEASERIEERERLTRQMAERLLAGVPEDPVERSREQQAVWLLANMLEWHRREDKAAWWEYFRLRELPDEELLDEMSALSGLEFVERVGGTARAPVDRYRFGQQETRIRKGDKLHLPLPDGGDFGAVEDIDFTTRTVDVKKLGRCADVHPGSLFAYDRVPIDVLEKSLLRFAGWVAENSIDAPGSYRAARDLLLGLEPRLTGRTGGDLRAAGEGAVEAARRLVLALEHGTLAIQGPPGSGKTYTGARMIYDLVRRGRRVGICAVSHKVIRNLLEAVSKAAAEDKRELPAVQKVGKDFAGAPLPGVREVDDNGAVLAALQSNQVRIAGGTAWLWSRPEYFESVDVLFVDEAGQMSLANVLAIAGAAKNLVLLGDPRQLEQPIQGSHPEGTAVSALEHFLDGHLTIPPDRGLFLDETWRLPPEICDFTSELFYEKRLEPRFGAGIQVLSGAGPFDGAGLWFVPVEHDANQSASREEVRVVAALHKWLLESGVVWRDREGKTHPLTLEDILVVAPYNAQVADLLGALPHGARVGTVDRFQGQEAPVVIFSLTSSSPEDAPRGMEFLFDSNRFNVGTSRAICACIVVGSPRLFEPDCQSPRQMKLANAFCRYLEMAREVPWPATS